MISFLLATHHGGWFPTFPFLFFGLWVLFFVFVVRRRWNPPSRQSGESVLAERYARGEIDEAEYRQRLSVLRTKPSR
jgi:putative membrane protein